MGGWACGRQGGPFIGKRAGQRKGEGKQGLGLWFVRPILSFAGAPDSYIEPSGGSSQEERKRREGDQIATNGGGGVDFVGCVLLFAVLFAS